MNCEFCLLIKLRSLICIFSLLDVIQFSSSMCYKSKIIIDLYLNFRYVQYSVALQLFTLPSCKCVVTFVWSS